MKNSISFYSYAIIGAVFLIFSAQAKASCELESSPSTLPGEVRVWSIIDRPTFSEALDSNSQVDNLWQDFYRLFNDIVVLSWKERLQKTLSIYEREVKELSPESEKYKFNQDRQKIIRAVMSETLGTISRISGLAWALFKIKLSEFPSATLPYGEANWYVLKNGSDLKIFMASNRGAQTSVSTVWLDKAIEPLLSSGWRWTLDIHNHPALHKHPYYYMAESLGPDLVPSPSDLRSWRESVIQRKLENAAITDGIQTIHFSSEEIIEK